MYFEKNSVAILRRGGLSHVFPLSLQVGVPASAGSDLVGKCLVSVSESFAVPIYVSLLWTFFLNGR